MSIDDLPVLIIGAGVVGLTLAHGLQKAGIPFEIYERGTSLDSRDQGWAITLHWVLPYLQQLLEPEVYHALDSVQVDPEVGKNDKGNFLFLNLATEEVKFKIPPNPRRRVGRERLVKLLLENVAGKVHWGKRLVDIETNGDNVKAKFADGTVAMGSTLVGAEGTNSRTRKFLRPHAYENYELPIRLLGVAVEMTAGQVAPLRQLDPLLFKGCHPDTGTFMWCSMLDVPETNGTLGTSNEVYRVQLILSWEVKEPKDEIETGDEARLQQMQRKAIGFSSKLKSAIDNIPPGTSVLQIKLVDWPCAEWDNSNGTVTLAGDAAHAMTMYRGEAANHGILDAFRSVEVLKSVQDGTKQRKEALDHYEAEMRGRTRPAVLLSRQACLDAHDYASLSVNSALLKRRAIET